MLVDWTLFRNMLFRILQPPALCSLAILKEFPRCFVIMDDSLVYIGEEGTVEKVDYTRRTFSEKVEDLSAGKIMNYDEKYNMKHQMHIQQANFGENSQVSDE